MLVRQQMDVEVSAAAIRVDDDDTLEVIAACEASALIGLRIAPGTGLGGQAAVLRHPVAVTDYCTSSDISHDYDDDIRAAGLRAVLAAPILRGHRLYGVLYAAHRFPARGVTTIDSNCWTWPDKLRWLWKSLTARAKCPMWPSTPNVSGGPWRCTTRWALRCSTSGLP